MRRPWRIDGRRWGLAGVAAAYLAAALGADEAERTDLLLHTVFVNLNVVRTEVAHEPPAPVPDHNVQQNLSRTGPDGRRRLGRRLRGF